MERIKEEIVVEVKSQQECSDTNYHVTPAKTTKWMSISLRTDGESYNQKRSAAITIPGSAPIGTRFKVTIEQLDDFNEVVIQRAALPTTVDGKLLVGKE